MRNGATSHDRTDCAAATIPPPSKDDVEEALRDVVDPELGINVVDLGLIYGLDIAEDATVTVDMTLTSAACPLTDVIEDQAHSALTGGPKPLASAHEDQLGLDAAVGSGQDHRRRPRTAAGARLQRLSATAAGWQPADHWFPPEQ